MNIYQVLMLFASVLLTLQEIPQNYKIYQNKSARDFSYLAIVMNSVGVSIVIIYGLRYGLVEIWGPPILTLFSMAQLVGMKIYYEHYYVPEQPPTKETQTEQQSEQVVLDID